MNTAPTTRPRATNAGRPSDRKWNYTPHDAPRVSRLADALDVTPLTAQVLIARGLDDPAEARDFLDASPKGLHPPETLPGLHDAAARIVAALDAGRRITVYGDYDADGVTATALLVRGLRLAGAEVDYYIPSRLEEGYGLNADALRTLHAEDPDRLVVSVDCGIASVAEAAVAADLGLELIVTDHHNPGDTLPAAAALVHPRLPGCEPAPFGDLCGAGVAFKLAWRVAVLRGDGGRAADRMRDFLIEALGIAAVGTVADVVPLRGENRMIVRGGLSSLFHRAGPGLRALCGLCGIEAGRPISAEDIGFKLAPRINAAGRLGQAGMAVELLLSTDPHRIGQLTAYLDDLNDQRKRVERKILSEARAQLKEDDGWRDRPAAVLAHADWHPGVIGIVAGRLAERYGRPTILLALGNGTAGGSARSHAGFDLHAGLHRCREHLTTFGGHRAAAGLKLDAGRLDAFREAFCADVAANHAPTEDDLALSVDAEVRLADVNLHAVKELDAKLGPFGQSHRRPTFVATDVTLAGPPKTMGKEDAHLSLRLKQYGRTLRAVAFGRGEWAAEIQSATDGGMRPLSVSFTAEVNAWQGRENAELKLTDWRVGSS